MNGACPKLDDAAAFALHALSDEELSEFQRHLGACRECQAELNGWEPLVRALPLSVSQLTPSRALRARLMAEVRADSRERNRATRPRRAWLGAPALAGFAGACAAVVVAVAVLAGSGGGSARHVYGALVKFHGAAATLRTGGGSAELVVDRIPAPPAGKVYEVWVARPGRAPQPTSALFDVNASGSTSVAVPASLRGASAVMVTAEPDGGSARPTSQPVIIARL